MLLNLLYIRFWYCIILDKEEETIAMHVVLWAKSIDNLYIAIKLASGTFSCYLLYIYIYSMIDFRRS